MQLTTFRNRTVISIVLAGLFFIWSNRLMATMGPCTPVGGTHVYNVNSVQENITDIDKSRAGTILTDIFNFDVTYGSYYQMKGCSSHGPAYITTTSDLPVIGPDSSGGNWYELNEYLGISMKGWIEGSVSQYFPVPFVSKSNKDAPINDNDTWTSGGRGKISLLIRRAFVGFSSFSKVVMHSQISTDPNTGNAGPYVSEVIISGGVTVPQSCQLDAGQTVTIGFGDIGASAFPQAGVGNRPAGVNPKTRTIAIKCKNIDAQAVLSLRLEANNVSGNAIISDNPDLGFVVADSKQTPLTPNMIDSKIKFQLDDNASACVPISAWPVSVTGNKPAEGSFTSEGYLRVDFD